MRFMLLTKGDVDSIDAIVPNTAFITDMLGYIEDLKGAGALITVDGFHPTSNATRVVFSPGREQASLVEGPFNPKAEQVTGYFLIDVNSKDEAIEWAKKMPLTNSPTPSNESPVIEVRQVLDTQEELPAMALQERVRDLRIRRGLAVA